MIDITKIGKGCSLYFSFFFRCKLLRLLVMEKTLLTYHYGRNAPPENFKRCQAAKWVFRKALCGTPKRFYLLHRHAPRFVLVAQPDMHRLFQFKVETRLGGTVPEIPFQIVMGHGLLRLTDGVQIVLASTLVDLAVQQEHLAVFGQM